MPRYIFFPPDVALSLSRRSVARLVARVPSLEGSEPGDLAFARVLFCSLFSDSEADLLDEVAHFSTTMGQDAILEAASAVGREVPSWRELTPPDLAVLLVCNEASEKGGAGRVLRLARVRLGRLFAPQASYDVMTADSAAFDAADLKDAATRVHGPRLITTFDVVSGADVHVAVVHEGPPRTLVQRSLGDGGALLRKARVRAIGVDILHFAKGRRRITLSLARAQNHAPYVEALDAAHGAGEILAHRPTYTLKPLHENGSGWLRRAKLPHPVTSVEVAACELDHGRKVSVRGESALDHLLAELGKAGGYIYRATLRFRLADAGSVDATIELPSKLIVSHPRFREAVPVWVGLLGLTDAGALPDDLTSLAPFTQPLWRWVTTFGEEAVRRAELAKILVRTTSRRAADKEHRRWGSMYVAHDVPGETSKYAVADDWGAPAHLVAPSALERLSLDAKRLRDVLREQLSLDAWEPSDAPDAALALGTVRVGDTTIAVFLLFGIVREEGRRAFAERLRKISGGRHVVLLVPETRPQGGVVVEVPISRGAQLGVVACGDAIVRAAAQIGIASALPAWRFATEERPLVLAETSREVWYGKVRLLLPEKARQLLFCLAETDADSLSAEEVGKKLSPSSGVPDQVGRRARLDLVKAVERSFEEAGVAMPDGLSESIVSGGRGYRIGVGFVKISGVTSA